MSRSCAPITVYKGGEENPKACQFVGVGQQEFADLDDVVGDFAFPQSKTSAYKMIEGGSECALNHLMPSV